MEELKSPSLYKGPQLPLVGGEGGKQQHNPQDCATVGEERLFLNQRKCCQGLGSVGSPTDAARVPHSL